jgi:hypothetical protein
MPMIGAVIVDGCTEPYGSRYSGPGFTACPGTLHFDVAMKLSARCCGMKTSSTTMSFEPVPRRPTVSQTSTME